MNKKKKIAIIVGTVIIAVIVIVASVVIAKFNSNLPANATLENTQPSSVSSTQSSSTTSTTITTTTRETTTQKVTEKTTQSASSDLEVLDLVNYKNTIDESYVPKLKTLSNGMEIDERAYDALNEMLDDARAAGYNPVISSAYRSYSYQQKLYDRKINQYLNNGYSRSEAEKKAGEWVAKPGTSEHQTGLAVDLTSLENQNLDDSQLNTKCQQWYMANCWKYGFILRYPSDKKDITKINSEPWHYRYVGKEAAKEIYDKGICLEEYLGQA